WRQPHPANSQDHSLGFLVTSGSELPESGSSSWWLLGYLGTGPPTRRVTVKRRILVVDDDDAARQAAVLSLRAVPGWDVAEAYCGAQAIESARQHQPDAILLEVMMPARDGPAMLAKLRTVRATSHIPIVLLTAKVQAVEDGSLA